MIGEVIQIGDMLEVEIGKENREWGYNPCDDGTIVEVVGFGRIASPRKNPIYQCEPGIYENPSWVTVKENNGKEHSINSLFLNLIDKEEQEKREEKYRKTENKSVFKKKIRELPETHFYEDDVVLCPKIGEELFTISSINYHYMKEDGTIDKCNDGVTDMPIYTITKERFGYTSVREEDLELVQRGNFWRHYKGHQKQFSSLEEEAIFAMNSGKFTELKNPKYNLYRWTKEEVIEQIKKGYAHGFSCFNGLFGSGIHISAVKFDDEELGQRVAQETLKGFNRGVA